MPSPMWKTRGSRRISSKRALLSASRYIISGMGGSVRRCRRGSLVERREELGHVRLRRLPGEGDGLVELRLDGVADLLQLRLGPDARPEDDERIPRLPLGQELLVHVRARVVHVVAAVAVGLRLDERGTLAAEGARDRGPGLLV